MQNLASRVVVFFVAVPALVVIVLFLPYYNNLAVNLVAVAASALGARELAQLFERKHAGYRASSVVIPLLGATLPLVQLLALNGLLPETAVLTALYAVSAVILLVQITRHNEEDFRHTLNNTAANISVLVYPGLFLAYFLRLSVFPYSPAVILTFLCMVFFNDTMAYIAGRLYRRVRENLAQRRGQTWEPRFAVPVSPQKTFIGFAAGIALSPITLLVARRAVPHAFPWNTATTVVVGVLVGVTVVLGDLVESALKRSATSKDSGSLIPGRGGMLDSVDSILYAAPVFYYLLMYAV